MYEDFIVYIDLTKKIFPYSIDKVDAHFCRDDILVIETNSKWMFRFPRNDSSQMAFEKEIDNLQKLEITSPLSFPDYQYIGNNFAGYPKFRGVPLNVEFYKGLSKEN